MNKIFKNFFAIVSGNVLGKLIFFLFSVYIARVFGSEAFGSVNFANSIVSYFIMFSSMGLQTYAILSISKNIDLKNTIYNKILSSRIILAAISFTFLIIVIPFINISFQNKIMTILCGLTIITNALNIDWYFSAIQEMKYISYSIIIQNIVSFLLLILLMESGILRSIYIIPISIFIGTLLSNIFMFLKVKKDIIYKFDFSFNELKGFIKKSFPFFFSGVFAIINTNIDILIMGFISSSSEVGIYSAAYKIINILMIGVSMVFTPIYPVIIGLYSNKKYNELNDILVKVKKILICLSLPLMFGGAFLSNEIINFVFGIEYIYAGNTLKILIIYIGLFYIRELYGYQLNAFGNQKSYMNIVLISAATNIILNLIFIPKYGATAAATATLISEIINLILMRQVCKRNYRMIIYDSNSDYIKIFISCVLMSMFIIFIKRYSINVLIIILLSIIIYFAFIMIFKVFTLDYFRILKNRER